MDPRLEITPRASRSSSNASRKSVNLTLDFSNLPPVTQPTPPSNTLLFTNLTNPETFTPDSLQAWRKRISDNFPVHSFCPLRGLSRIIISFFDDETAVAARSYWDGQSIDGNRVRIYFGIHTPLQPKDASLQLPDAGKLFFISPPPSPPHGWEVRLEDAPNKLVHAADLADALAKLHHRDDAATAAVAHGAISPVSPVAAGFPGKTRTRSSTLIYQPDSKSPHMPAVVVDDMSDETEDLRETSRPIMAHTSRPPVELMNE